MNCDVLPTLTHGASSFFNQTRSPCRLVIDLLSYKAEEKGIAVKKQEESHHEGVFAV